MEIVFPELRCELSPNHIHHFVQVTESIWRCKYCWVVKWLPSYWEEARKFSDSIRTMGLDRAYKKHLQHRPKIRQTLIKLEEIRLLRKVLPDEDLMNAIVAIVIGKAEDEEEGDGGCSEGFGELEALLRSQVYAEGDALLEGKADLQD